MTNAITLDLTEEEIWFAARRPDSEEWKKVFVKDRETTEFRDRMKQIAEHGYDGVIFCHGGDQVAFVKVHSVWTPWDIDRADYQPAGHYGMEFEGATWRRIPPDNTGYWQHRIADHVQDDQGKMERAMAEQWLKENEERSGLNYGMGILQDLMLSTLEHERPKGFIPWVSNRERKIVATVIQWLSTNCGRSFLFEASKRMGRAVYPFTPPPKQARPLEPEWREELDAGLRRVGMQARLEFFERLFSIWCQHCGAAQSPNRRCQCKRDE